MRVGLAQLEANTTNVRHPLGQRNANYDLPCFVLYLCCSHITHHLKGDL